MYVYILYMYYVFTCYMYRCFAFMSVCAPHAGLLTMEIRRH